MNKPIFKALMGSQNYNLQIPTSDRDYHVFVCPTFDDLYVGKNESVVVPIENGEETIHDIRRLPQLLYKTSINFTECLFTDTKQVYEEGFNEILEMRDALARMNLPHLFNFCYHSSKATEIRMRRPTTFTQESHDKCGYDIKKAYHVFRFLDFLERYSKTSFESFGDAIRYDKNEESYDTLMIIRSGRMPLEAFKKIQEEKLEKALLLKSLYASYGPDEALRMKTESIVREMVENELWKEKRGA